MKTYARIESGFVAELFSTDGDITQMFNPALVWVDTGTAPVQQGWSYAAGVFAAPAPAAPTADQLKAAGEAAIQNLLDTTAQAHGYDSLERCISYIGDAVAFWNSEGTRAKAWRSECWSKAKQIQDDATAGNWPTVGAGQMPTPADVVAAMPPANWPVA